MNYWKPLALTLAVGLVASVGIQSASANNSGSQPTLAGPCHDQRNMAAALDHLTQAKDALSRAEHNKGGWRDRAIEATNKAFNETNQGCLSDGH
jgi:hypothetical protein